MILFSWAVCCWQWFSLSRHAVRERCIQVGTLVGCTTAWDCQVRVTYQSTSCPRHEWRPMTHTVTCWCSGDSLSTTTSTSCPQRSPMPGSVMVATAMRLARQVARAFPYRSVLTIRGCVVVDASDLFARAPCVAGTVSHQWRRGWSWQAVLLV